MARPLATVHLADDRCGLELKPNREDVDPRELLRQVAPGLRPRRRGSRLVIDWEQATKLIQTGTDESLDFTPEAARAAHNRYMVQNRAPEVVRAATRLKQGGPTAAEEDLADVLPRLSRLDRHQLVNVATMTIPGGWGACVFDEQGTGKTVTTMAAYDVLVERGESSLLLVVAPKSMLQEWANEFRRFYGDLYHTAVLQGPRREKLRALDSGADVFIANYEAVSSLGAELTLRIRQQDAVLTVDESFFVKNPGARRTAALAGLREWCGRAWVLCGTPAPNHPTDLVAQFDLVDFGFTFGSRARHFDEDRDVAEQQVGAELSRGIWTRSRKEDVLTLPTASFNEVMVDMSPDQERAYQAALEDLLLDLEATDDQHFEMHRMSFLERRAALLRIASNPQPFISGYNEVPGKVKALDRLLDDFINTRGEKVVLWSFYRANLDLLRSRFRGYGAVRVDGSVTDSAERGEAVRRFQEDPDTYLFVGNPAAAGAGLTLHSGRIAIYESLSNQAAHYLQSLDRIHRRGQSRDVEYLTLLSRGTIEEGEYSRLKAKAQGQASLLRDRSEAKVTRQWMLGELLEARGVLRGECDGGPV